MAIAVDREGVLVRAPAETPLDRLDEIVRGKAVWITARLRRFRELPPPLSERQFVSGETFLYLVSMAAKFRRNLAVLCGNLLTQGNDL